MFDCISRGSSDDYAITERWSIDVAVQRRKKHKQFCLQYRKCARPVDRIISSSDSSSPEGFERRFANNIVYLRSLSLPIRVGLHAWP